MWSLASMDPHVPMEFAGMLECPGANFAFVRSFFGVNSSVDAEVFLHAETLVAELASAKESSQ